jgi:hypothetical protein
MKIQSNTKTEKTKKNAPKIKQEKGGGSKQSKN